MLERGSVIMDETGATAVSANLVLAEKLQLRARKAQEMCAEVKADLMKVIEVFWQEIRTFAAFQCISCQ